MFSRIYMIAWSCVLFSSGPALAINERARPMLHRRALMSENVKGKEKLDLPTATKPEGAQPLAAKPRTQIIRVRLSQLVLRVEDYSHRAKGALERDALRPLLDSIKMEGLRHPPEVFALGDGTYVIVSGHRRYSCLVLLAQDGVAGFAMDMEVEVVELLDTTPLDRLALSVAENEIRLNLTPSERFDVEKKFVRAGMPDERGAAALGLSLKQYRRDLTLVRNTWMLDLVAKE